MGRRKKSLGKTINPTYYVFCEGDTEEEYIKHLKHHYRIPIEIKTKVEGNSISDRKIKSFLRDRPTSSKDKTFLLYDADVSGVLEKLKNIKNTTLLISNPCIELWFLLHYKDQTANIDTANCVKKMNDSWKDYKKGFLNSKSKAELIEKQEDALARAEKLNPNNNPSTTIPELIKILEQQQKIK
jgi:hypothetical protein|tara:strand:- start:2970 stop:3521 length:552 start_codon:yes stop_codon:yes gene_type:complete